MPSRPEFLEENVQRHVAETVKRLVGATRESSDQSWGVHNAILVLLDNAVAATAPFTEIESSELVPWRGPNFSPPSPEHGAVHQILVGEAFWLTEHPEIWTFYGNELMRLSSRDEPSSVHSTSQGFEQVVLAVCRGLALNERESLSILDPACGRGTLLSALAHQYKSIPVLLAGQDIDRDSLPMASRNLALAGRVAIFAEGDLLKVDGHPESTFDLVVLDGPLGPMTSSQDGNLDNRYPSDLPVPQDPSWLMLMMALSKVKLAEDGGGTLVATLTPNAIWASKRGLNEIRTWIQDRDLVQAIVALPHRVGSLATGIQTYAIVLTTRKAKSFERRTQVIDLRGSFEGGNDRQQSRLISSAGLEELSRAITTAKASGLVRTRTASELEYREWTYQVPATSVIHDGTFSRKATFDLAQPANMSSGIWPDDRWKDKYAVKAVAGQKVFVVWDVDKVFGSRLSSASRKALESTGWPIRPLLLDTKHLEYRRSQGAASGTAETPWNSKTSVLVIPLIMDGRVAYGPLEEVGSENRAIMVELDGSIDGRFLAAWFATANGRSALRAAGEAAFRNGNGLPGRNLLRDETVSFLAHLLVPAPDSVEQEQILDSHEIVNSRLVRLRELNTALWARPSEAAEIVSVAKGLTQERDIEAWANSLPYPLAIALRTVQASEHDDEKAIKQAVHFWEATSTFIAYYLISSLQAADDLWVAEVPKLRSALQGGGHSFDRPALGTWRITIERLSSLLREKLQGSDPDERERARLLLGNPPESVLSGVLSKEFVKLLSRLSQNRNKLDGHAGTRTAAQAASVRSNFALLTDELRSVLGYGWSDFPMIRPGGLDFDDSGFTVSAEVLVGPTTPFLTRKLSTPDPLKTGRLYLLGDGGVVELAPFVQLGKAPEDPETTCWFYKGRESKGVRLVTYSTADNSDVTRSDEPIEALLEDLGTIETPAAFPDLSALDDAK